MTLTSNIYIISLLLSFTIFVFIFVAIRERLIRNFRINCSIILAYNVYSFLFNFHLNLTKTILDVPFAESPLLQWEFKKCE